MSPTAPRTDTRCSAAAATTAVLPAASSALRGDAGTAMTKTMSQAAVFENHARIRKVPCPRCGAAPGKSCARPNGQWTFPHQERRRAAAEAGCYTP